VTYNPSNPGFSNAWGTDGDYVNSYFGDFDGGHNPNTSFNPNAGGIYSSGGNSFKWGGDLANGQPLPINSTPAKTPQNSEYQNWNWEQILNTVLGLTLPNRSEILDGRWTGIEFDSDGDGNRFYIYGTTWGPDSWDPAEGASNQDSLVYLSPAFTTQNAPWPTYQWEPYTALGHLTPGPDSLYSPGGTVAAMDPSTFAGPVQALMGVEAFYACAVNTLQPLVNGLQGDNTQFAGKAGAAFATLMQDLLAQANYVSQTMGTLSDIFSSYSQLLYSAGISANEFMYQIWNAYANWSQLMTYSPLGCILWTLIEAGLVIGSPGNWQTNPDVDPENAPVYGDMRYDEAWLKVEVQAKQYWTNTLNASLDPAARSAIGALVNSYNNTSDGLQPLFPPTPAPIASGSGGANSSGTPNIVISIPNNLISIPNNLIDIPNNLISIPNNLIDIPNNLISIPNSLISIPNNLIDIPNSLFNIPNSVASSYVPNSVTSSYVPNSVVSSYYPNVAGLDVNNPGYGSLGDNVNSYYTDLGNSADASTLFPNTVYSSVPSSTVSDLDSNPAEEDALESALADNSDVQSALQSALASGQVPPNSPLANTLQTALADSDDTEAALNQAAAAGDTGTSAIQSALADNGNTQSALTQALASGQVPASSPLASTLRSALNNSNNTQSALTQALANSGTPSNAQSSLLQTALGDNSKAQNALTQALVSGQVSAHSPLASTIQSALTDTGRTQSALNQALTSGTSSTTAALNRALTDNQAVQKELHAALASGQVPSSGPLHTDLENALADSNNLSSVLHKALASQGTLAEPNLDALSSTGGLSGLGPTSSSALSGLGGGAGGALSNTPLLSATGSSAHAAGLAGTASTPVSSGRFVTPTSTQGTTTSSSASGEDPFPMYSPMAGGGGGGMGSQFGNQDQERERSTWLAEDEDVWGTEPAVGPQVIGRDFTMDEEPEDYDVFADRPQAQPRRVRRRQDGR
jgi:hypothetical protein